MPRPFSAPAKKCWQRYKIKVNAFAIHSAWVPFPRSSNFQLSFLQPALDDQELEVVIHSASLRVLMTQLNTHTIDLVLSNNPVMRDQELKIHCQQIAEQPVSLVAPPNWITKTQFNFPQDLQQKPMVLPGLESTIRASFDLIMEQSGIAPLIAAEADSMAMLRLIARETKAITPGATRRGAR